MIQFPAHLLNIKPLIHVSCLDSQINTIFCLCSCETGYFHIMYTIVNKENCHDRINRKARKLPKPARKYYSCLYILFEACYPSIATSISTVPSVLGILLLCCKGDSIITQLPDMLFLKHHIGFAVYLCNILNFIRNLFSWIFKTYFMSFGLS